MRVSSWFRASFCLAPDPDDDEIAEWAWAQALIARVVKEPCDQSQATQAAAGTTAA